MPKYRLIGYYHDNGQVYDSTWEGGDCVSAGRAFRDTVSEWDSMNLVLVAILDEAGVNVYEPDAAVPLTDFVTAEDD